MSDDITQADTDSAARDAAELTRLCADFPQFGIWREAPADRPPRFVAQRLRDDINPAVVITHDAAELRDALYYGDNLGIMRESVEDESADLAYLDPPFNSNRPG